MLSAYPDAQQPAGYSCLAVDCHLTTILAADDKEQHGAAACKMFTCQESVHAAWCETFSSSTNLILDLLIGSCSWEDMHELTADQPVT